MDNKELQKTYDDMHKQGVTAWFSDGREERETILKMGEPWEDSVVLEIGCGEGDLANLISQRHVSSVTGIDYSMVIERAQKKYPDLKLRRSHYRKWNVFGYDRLVLQGVLEHLDDPFAELQWMIEHFNPKDVITSSPCFLNPRGIVWMTLDMLGAVMSKTDLHFLHPWQFDEFCKKHGYTMTIKDCDWDWGNGRSMVEDLRQRIPLALKDGSLPVKSPEDILDWLSKFQFDIAPGATMVYRITK